MRPDGCATGSTSAWWLITSEIEGIQVAWLADESVDMAAHLAVDGVAEGSEPS